MQNIDYGEIASSVLTVYANMFANFTLDAVLAQMQLIVVVKTLYFVISAFLPIEGLVNTIFSPFSYLHQIFHAHAAKKLNHKYRNHEGKRAQHVRMNVSLGDSSVRKKEYTNLSFMMNNASGLTIRDVTYFANASSAPAFVMVLAIVSIGPLMQDILFAAIHMYVLLGIVLCLMPSKADSKLIVNFILIRTEISPWYVVFILVVFLLSAGVYAYPYIYAQYYPPFWGLEPLLMGIWGVMSYLFLFSFIVLVTDERTLFPNLKKHEEVDLADREFGLDNEHYHLTDEEAELMDELNSLL